MSNSLMPPTRTTWRQRLSLAIYNCLISLAKPLVLAKLKKRGRQETGYLTNIDERFGYYSRQPASTQPYLWLHAVSLGESRLAAIFMQHFRQQYPHWRLLITNGTATGRQASQAILQDGDMQVWQPWDSPSSVQRFLNYFQPKLALILETEVWPNLIERSVAQNIPIFLINARLSEKSYRKALKWRSLMAPTYAAFTGVISQNPSDSNNFKQLGANVLATLGNIKFDISIDHECQKYVQLNWSRPRRPTLVLASSRDGEEQMLLSALSKLSQQQLAQINILVVPRHPQRFTAVADLFQAANWQVKKRSTEQDNFLQPANHSSKVIYLGDSIGEMPIYYCLADLALLGGSFQPCGGQNLIEALAYGCPVISGPSCYNFQQAVEQAMANQVAITSVDMQQALTIAIDLLLTTKAKLAHMQRHATKFIARHSGASQASLQVLAKYID